MKTTLPAILVAVSAILLMNATFIVTEGQQALVTQFGKIIGQPITDAGMHFKLPFINDVRMMDKRILTWDGEPEQIPTKDKKYIWADTTARWRIVDARKFAYTVKNERMAQGQLDSTLDGITRDVISNQNLVEAVRNTNQILKKKTKPKPAQKDKTSENDSTSIKATDIKAEQIEEEISGEIEPVTVGREKLSQMIIQRARKEISQYGIELIDVQLRRIAYETSVEKKVYDRMISERNRIAEKIRSIGQGEKAKIDGKLNRDLKEIESIAYRTSQEIKGKADAKAIIIYAKAMGADPEFYRFARTLEAYENTLTDKTKLILSTNSDFFKIMNRGK
jgi:modulator of FtsH protease HflC